MPIDVSFPLAPVTAATAVTPEVVKKYFAVAKTLVTGARLFVLMTKTKDDDAILDAIEKALVFAEPYLDQAWAYDVVNLLIGLFQDNPKQAALTLVAALQAVPAK